MDRIKTLLKNQIDFQKLVGLPIDTKVESERNELAEIYIFKMIEEAVELRREFPSTMNKWSKYNKPADMARIKEELSDVMFFLINFILTFKLTPEEILEQLESVQANNFQKVKAKMMKLLNEDILKVQNHTSGIGQGNLSPKYIFIGQNPGEGITQGYEFWSDENDGSSKVLLPILDKLGIRGDCYFTNIVKSTTPGNAEPDEDLTKFWKEFLVKEIQILKANNPDAKIIALGTWSSINLPEFEHTNVYHPAYVLRGGFSSDDYEKQIQGAIAHID